MSLELLDKTRQINRLLTGQGSDKIDFEEFCQVLSQAMHVHVVLVSKKGKLLGSHSYHGQAGIATLDQIGHGQYLSEALQDRLLGILSTKENVNLQTLGFDEETAMRFEAMAVPVIMSGSRLGTLLVYRQGGAFSLDDIILTENATIVIGLAMQRAVCEENTTSHQKEQDVRSAVRSLSRLEARAMLYVLEEMQGQNHGVLVTRRLADRVGITRSIIVNALKKCESAELIRTKSGGVKGTSIWITNEWFTPEMIQRCVRRSEV